MITCAHCGSHSEANKSFCAQCGNRLARQKTVPPVVTKSPATAVEVKTPPRLSADTPAAGNNPAKHKPRALPRFAVLGLALLLAISLIWAVAGELPVLGPFPLRETLQRLLGTLPDTMIELAPEDADIYLEIQVGESDQVAMFQEVLARFPEAREWESRFVDLFTVQESTGSGGMGWATDIKPWLGSEVGWVADLVPSEESSLAAHMAFLFATKDPTATAAFVQRLIDSGQAVHTEITYKKHVITKLQAIEQSDTLPPADENSLSVPVPEVLPPEDAATAGYLLLVGDYLVVSNSYDYLTHMIDSWKTRENFTKKAAYQGASSMLSAQSLGKLFVSPQSMPTALFELVALPSLLFDVPRAAAAAATQGSLPELIGLSLVATAEGLKFDLTLPGTGLDLLPRTLDRTLPTRLPGDAVLVVSLADFRAGMDNYFTALSAVDPTMGFAYESFVERFTDETSGFDLDTDVLSLLSDDLALVVTYENDFPQLSLVALLPAPETADARINTTIQFVESLLLATSALSPEQTLRAEEFSLFSEFRLEGDVPAWQLQYAALPEYINITYTRLGNLLVISTAPDGLAAFAAVEQKTRPSLADTPRFAVPAETLPEGALGVLYFDRARFSTALEGLYQTTDAAAEGQLNLTELNATLAPWQDVFGYLARTADGTVVLSLNVPVLGGVKTPALEK